MHLALLHSAVLALALTGPGSQSIIDDAIRAKDCLQLAAAHLGNPSVFAHIDSLHFEATGDVFNGLQGPQQSDVEKEVKMGTTSIAADFDFAGHRYRRRLSQTLPGNIELVVTALYSNGHLFTDYTNGHRSSQADVPEPVAADGLIRFVPALFLQRALKNSLSATFVGEYQEGNDHIAMVDVSIDATTRLRAHISTTDHRLLALESWAFDPLLGDDRLIYRFADEHPVGGLLFPGSITMERRGRAYIRWQVTGVSVNPQFEPAVFNPPSDEPLPSAITTTNLGGGTYEIAGLEGGTFRVFFFDLGDSVAVFDAPESRARSKAVVAEIKKTLGDKAVRYLILSHFHDDHIIGIGYYVNQGAQIVTIPENAPLVTRYARANSRIRPDLPPEAKEPSFLFVQGDRLLLSGRSGEKLEVRRLPSCPHANGMLVAVVPSQKLLVEADLFVELAAPSDASLNFLDWLKQSSLDVEWIAGPHLEKVSLQHLCELAGRQHCNPS